ncbi:peptidoglycan-binding protein [Pedobacter africanus]|uniref:Uncharacterized protein n=1 Tax=Pedobacter africanus TaxID=151894 RepID=A0ACC6L4Z7_9SPHI|nr:peptidoglycan-binding protein [Pedobacter africanus]MDR6786500.1 hypothetical protein [Pedobacter africanus]
MNIARGEIGVREVGNNDGKRVREYLAYTGIKTPAPWCSSFLSWVFGEAGYSEPKTAWSPAMFPKERLVYPSQPSAALPGGASEAMVIGIYFSSLKRIGHVGLIERLKGELIYSIEGNTNTNGSREGHGVFRKVRHLKTVSKVADWIN